MCDFEDGHSQTEQILDYSAEARSFGYLIEGAPLPVADNTGTFSVESADGCAVVVWESSFRASIRRWSNSPPRCGSRISR